MASPRRGWMAARLTAVLLAASPLSAPVSAGPATGWQTSGPWRLWLPGASPVRGVFLFNASEDAAEAKRILEAVDRWAKERLDEARAMEEDAPKGAKKLYEASAKRLAGLEPGAVAAARLKDPVFLRELEAWDRLERMARAEEAIRDVSGARRLVSDGKFVQANAGPLGTIAGEGRMLVARYGDTRAAASAKATLERYGIPAGGAK